MIVILKKKSILCFKFLTIQFPTYHKFVSSAAYALTFCLSDTYVVITYMWVTAYNFLNDAVLRKIGMKVKHTSLFLFMLNKVIF